MELECCMLALLAGGADAMLRPCSAAGQRTILSRGTRSVPGSFAGREMLESVLQCRLPHLAAVRLSEGSSGATRGPALPPQPATAEAAAAWLASLDGEQLEDVLAATAAHGSMRQIGGLLALLPPLSQGQALAALRHLPSRFPQRVGPGRPQDAGLASEAMCAVLDSCAELSGHGGHVRHGGSGGSLLGTQALQAFLRLAIADRHPAAAARLLQLGATLSPGALFAAVDAATALRAGEEGGEQGLGASPAMEVLQQLLAGSAGVRPPPPAGTARAPVRVGPRSRRPPCLLAFLADPVSAARDVLTQQRPALLRHSPILAFPSPPWRPQFPLPRHTARSVWAAEQLVAAGFRPAVLAWAQAPPLNGAPQPLLRDYTPFQGAVANAGTELARWVPCTAILAASSSPHAGCCSCSSSDHGNG
jgi:hypothetical protein